MQAFVIINNVGIKINVKKCRKKLVDKLVEKCSKNNDGNEIIHNDSGDVCNSCTI